jgi:hypothetical protein
MQVNDTLLHHRSGAKAIEGPLATADRTCAAEPGELVRASVVTASRFDPAVITWGLGDLIIASAHARLAEGVQGLPERAA